VTVGWGEGVGVQTTEQAVQSFILRMRHPDTQGLDSIGDVSGKGHFILKPCNGFMLLYEQNLQRRTTGTIWARFGQCSRVFYSNKGGTKVKVILDSFYCD